jgi:HD-GYP domain-containing protein (c-di-GMP phosphodiesterase class II)
MRFRTRAFLLYFVPFALLLTGSFWAMQMMVRKTVRDGLRASLRENHRSAASLRSRSDLQNNRFLKVAGENASLKAGMQLLAAYPADASARHTVEDQLSELCQRMGFDFLRVSDPRGKPLAGVIRSGEQLIPFEPPSVAFPKKGLLTVMDTVYRAASVPVDQGEENLGLLSVGEHFDFSGFDTPAVLIRNGQVLQSSIPGITNQEIAAALGGCHQQNECDIRLGAANYISLTYETSASEQGGDKYVLRTLQNVDAASGPVQAVLTRVFLIAAFGMVFASFVCSFASSQSIVEPVAAIISHLQASERTGLLPEFEVNLSSIREIRDLALSFNKAASAVHEARENLQRAYVEFVGSLASALDARDPYTAGHSNRVSALSCATAREMGLTPRELDEIRISSLLHDIGKIGISDTVLQKTGRLTPEEFALIQEHPVIGRRILEGVQGFAPYLAAVELHHENWDGTGYPKGQSGEATPVAARIVHVSDAYDAMTTDRPYRRGMSHEMALSILREFAGKHFDPRIVEAFANVAVRKQADTAEGRSQELAVSTPL